jgi:hypothetical protein
MIDANNFLNIYHHQIVTVYYLNTYFFRATMGKKQEKITGKSRSGSISNRSNSLTYSQKIGKYFQTFKINIIEEMIH